MSRENAEKVQKMLDDVKTAATPLKDIEFHKKLDNAREHLVKQLDKEKN